MSLKINELRIANLKRIVSFNIGPDGEPVLLTGDNRQGKSSVLDAIFIAFKNEGLQDPVRHGTSKAKIKLNIGGEEGTYIVERTITKKTSTLRVYTVDGPDIKSPQAFLDGLIGNLAFDPLEFMRMKPKAQAVAIRELVGLDTSALDKKYDTIFASRTEVNRAVASEEAQLQAMPLIEVPEDTKEEEVSASALMAKLDALNIRLANFTDAKRKTDEALKDTHAANNRVAELRKTLAEAEMAAAMATKQSNQLMVLIEGLKGDIPSPAEMSALNQQIADLDQTNKGIRDRQAARATALRKTEERNAKVAAVRATKERAQVLTDALDAIMEEKTKLVREVKMPVEGMTYDEEGVFIKGMRLDQLSTAEQVRTSAQIAMRGNNTLKIMLVREGALLNKENLKALMDAAKEGDYQLFIEKFQEEPGDAGLHIIDGSVSHIDGVPVAPAAPALALEGEDASA